MIYPKTQIENARGISCDIFCSVVDNFGDIGVCWTLARRIHSATQWKVRLWVDKLDVFAQIEPQLDPACARQIIEDVEICLWSDDRVAAATPARIVIEVFACEIPQVYIEQMVRQQASPIWINLEYLSAEKWVEDCHLQISIHPHYGLKKYFFFPGFTARTGGVLFDDRRTRIDLSDTPREALKISLFGYENTALESLLNVWVRGSQTIWCICPVGRLFTQLQTWHGGVLQPGERVLKGNLILDVLPFCSQPQYTQLLYECDFNFVRGEDSFIRTQWAARPFVWHIYPQQDDAHFIKLNAFLDLYCQAMPAAVATNLRKFWDNWNREVDVEQDWFNLVADLTALRTHAAYWQQHLATVGDLSKNLVKFCNSLIQ